MRTWTKSLLSAFFVCALTVTALAVPDEPDGYSTWWNQTSIDYWDTAIGAGELAESEQALAQGNLDGTYSLIDTWTLLGGTASDWGTYKTEADSIDNNDMFDGQHDLNLAEDDLEVAADANHDSIVQSRSSWGQSDYDNAYDHFEQANIDAEDNYDACLAAYNTWVENN